MRGSRKDAERELTRLLRTIDTSEHVGPSRLKVGQWLEHWLDTVRAEVSRRHMSAMRRSSSPIWSRQLETFRS